MSNEARDVKPEIRGRGRELICGDAINGTTSSQLPPIDEAHRIRREYVESGGPRAKLHWRLRYNAGNWREPLSMKSTCPAASS
jgi:hypothetical protein